ncbi:alkaline phosphatase [Fictibacillus macauensis ZFHKF-1]|uniref:Alkaline phosphatase n=1 Tax=Fictibacillus macauensis ZFHKF-1 TaxID=1196324 RepID=I8UGJ2_9BACL|nr:DedA family protein [Fictibacillus macauensis]EIT85985.1 alkaline phosphatase [Fictibacillus macauensis ZFHKF-1]
MSLDHVIMYLQDYGYWVIFLILLCGIVGIPAPEESFMFLLGVLIAKGQLSFEMSLLAAFAGTEVGMLISYIIGKKFGAPFIRAYGKYIKVTSERMSQVETRFHQHANMTILFGFYLPGLRQIGPYVAGISRYSFVRYMCLSVVGGAVWTTTFISVGYFFGDAIEIKYLPWIAVAALLVFVLMIVKKKFANKDVEGL